MGQAPTRTGLTDFLRKYGDFLTPNPSQEIARLEKKAEGLGFSTKNLFSVFYKLRRAVTGVKRPRRSKTEMVPKTEVVVDVPQASALSILDSVLATIRKEFEEMSQKLSEEKDRAEKLEEENGRLRSQIAELTSSTLQHKQVVAEIAQLTTKVPRPTSIQDGYVLVNRDCPPASFPSRSETERLPIQYRKSFLVDFHGLSKPEANQVVKALHNLAHYGHSYHALQAKKLKRPLSLSPGAVFYARASHKYRFTWLVNDEALVMCNIFHRGDSRLHFQEV
jgi:prefoldin subunit 5